MVSSWFSCLPRIFPNDFRVHNQLGDTPLIFIWLFHGHLWAADVEQLHLLDVHHCTVWTVSYLKSCMFHCSLTIEIEDISVIDLLGWGRNALVTISSLDHFLGMVIVYTDQYQRDIQKQPIKVTHKIWYFVIS